MQVTGTLRLASAVPANDPSLVDKWRSIVATAPDAAQCVADGTRDGVAVGSIQFSNATPAYSPANLILNVKLNAALRESFGAYYTNGPTCQDAFSATISPQMDGSTWGPVPIEIDIPGMYGPSGADESLFAEGQSVGLMLASLQPGVTLTPEENMQSFEGSDSWVTFDLSL